MDYNKEYDRWYTYCLSNNQELASELAGMTDAQKEDAFYRELDFGTAGLRGTIGAGTNRMNVYTVAKASQGLANYITKNFPADNRSVVIGYDSRIKSDVFAKVAAEVFAGNGIQVQLWSELLPVPTVSFATRYLKTTCGVMVTASHNPSKYNGYKVYGSDGCQMTSEAAEAVLSEINTLDVFADVKKMAFDEAVKSGLVKYIDPSVLTAFIECVKTRSVLFGDEVDKNVSVIYSPLNGTGLKPVTRILSECGYTNVRVVEEQRNPDGNFPTCPYPNPEIKEAMALGIEYAKKYDADLLLATDPDCDRVGIAVKNADGEHVLISGNETGILLLDYICSQRTKHGKMPVDPLFVKTIVTTDLGQAIADHYGVRTANVLTGFKYIGEQIGLLEQKNMADSFIFGYEESYGYLSGSHARDKDGVNAAFMICEMFCYYKTRGISLLDKIAELHKQYGYYLNNTHSFTFEGSAGFAKMQEIMQKMRGNIPSIGGRKVLSVLDYNTGIDGLPKSDVLKYNLEGGCSVIVRPSGTEPKLKAYLTVKAADREAALADEAVIAKDIASMLA